MQSNGVMEMLKCTGGVRGCASVYFGQSRPGHVLVTGAMLGHRLACLAVGELRGFHQRPLRE